MSSGQPPYSRGPQSGQWPEQVGYTPPPAYPPQPLYGPPGPPGYLPAYPPSGMAPVPGMPGAYPDRNRGIAVAGLIVGVCALTALVGAVLLFAAGHRISPTLLFLVSVPTSIVGVVLSGMGRKSTTRGGAALTGLILSIIVLVLVVLLIVVVIVGFVVFARRGTPIPYP